MLKDIAIVIQFICVKQFIEKIGDTITGITPRPKRRGYIPIFPWDVVREKAYLIPQRKIQTTNLWSTMRRFND